ncbi:hypothetical protein BCR44DRAFT_1489599 [Catenaria anguillulae PL171]|uniref:Protein kinase domain-containing protein n=1 Tax=Catenaria anguillulae PL171 TaxID=765915 RepID=A0A1Y2H553_9FUNG|nr:hypothetical protein BCR44DRAFT_1489599 [Catenaria anguillulae PL171]
MAGLWKGTRQYVAPGVVLDEPGRFAPPADVWGAGVILFQLACAVLPYPKGTEQALVDGTIFNGLAHFPTKRDWSPSFRKLVSFLLAPSHARLTVERALRMAWLRGYSEHTSELVDRIAERWHARNKSSFHQTETQSENCAPSSATSTVVRPAPTPAAPTLASAAADALKPVLSVGTASLPSKSASSRVTSSSVPVSLSSGSLPPPLPAILAVGAAHAAAQAPAQGFAPGALETSAAAQSGSSTVRAAVCNRQPASAGEPMGNSRILKPPVLHKRPRLAGKPAAAESAIGAHAEPQLRARQRKVAKHSARE